MPRGAGEAACRAMLAGADLLALSESGEPPGLEVPRALLRALVPRPPSIGVAEARPGIEQHQSANHLRVGEVKGERHVAAERETGDDRALDPTMVQQCRHVSDGQRLGIGRGILRVVGLAVNRACPKR
jgi:hypothetical protein